MNFSFEERLDWFNTNHYEYGNSVKVIEREIAGEAEIVISSTDKLLSINVSHKNRINYIKRQNVADGVICRFLEDYLELHIIECKKTATHSSWSKAKKQFEGGLLNSFALCGLLNKDISKILFYTAFREEKFDNVNSADPVLLKATLGTNQKTSAIDWNSKDIDILNGKFEHKKIKLDYNGKGSLTL